MSLDKRVSVYKGYETPLYTVLEQSKNIEVRLYAGKLVAEVEVVGQRDKAINEGFTILAKYIFGDNVSKEKISMTTPVNQLKSNENISMTTPVLQIGENDRWIVQFVMPSKYTLNSLPLAKDSRIIFKSLEEMKKVVIRFSGFISDKNLLRNLKELDDFITKKSLKVCNLPQYAFYDPPWTLPFMRRNEIAYVIVG